MENENLTKLERVLKNLPENQLMPLVKWTSRIIAEKYLKKKQLTL